MLYRYLKKILDGSVLKHTRFKKVAKLDVGFTDFSGNYDLWLKKINF